MAVEFYADNLWLVLSALKYTVENVPIVEIEINAQKNKFFGDPILVEEHVNVFCRYELFV